MPSTPTAAERYCRAALPRVSRTFAVNIRLLEGRLGNAVRIGYLLCRMADTLEDGWPDSQPPEVRFGLLLDALDGVPDAPRRLSALATLALGDAAAGPELELVQRAPWVFARLQALPGDDRDIVCRCVTTLASGMHRFAERAAERNGRAYLETEQELHDYCYTVAGCVGEMLTRLYLALSPGARGAETLARLAPRFGEGLQLTNVLLDLPDDLRRGRCYVPQAWLADERMNPAALLDATRGDSASRVIARLERLALAGLDAAWSYTLALPARHWRYRLFCAWPALWAAASLAEARRSPDFVSSGVRPRIARGRVRGLATAAALRVGSSRALEELYRRVRPADAAP
jgi:farnesyl-diphosphate farnesyltransferase